MRCGLWVVGLGMRENRVDEIEGIDGQADCYDWIIRRRIDGKIFTNSRLSGYSFLTDSSSFIFEAINNSNQISVSSPSSTQIDNLLKNAAFDLPRNAAL